jgi:hypothetical protein
LSSNITANPTKRRNARNKYNYYGTLMKFVGSVLGAYFCMCLLEELADPKGQSMNYMLRTSADDSALTN